MKASYDYIIIGAGIIGLTIAKALIEIQPSRSILILEKEKELGIHASGKNSGVLHAGFYYSKDSLKAKFTRDGNLEIKKFCKEHNIRINFSEKFVVAQQESEVETIKELHKRGINNNVEVEIINKNDLAKVQPNIRTTEIALYSPSTATVNPKEVLEGLSKFLKSKGVDFLFDEGFLKPSINKKSIETTGNNEISYGKLINSAGLYADRIAKQYGFSKDYTIIPFKGIYLYYTKDDNPISTNVYPVPNLKNPFLGVHYTVTVDKHLKIGPTSIPSFWRENYSGFNNFKPGELFNILSWEAKLFLLNSFGFRNLAFDEIKKYNKKHFTGLAKEMLHNIDLEGFTKWGDPGIRAQLLNKKNNKLEMDFVVEGDKDTVHVLNAVSPAFTCSIPFSRWIVDNYIINS